MPPRRVIPEPRIWGLGWEKNPSSFYILRLMSHVLQSSDFTYSFTERRHSQHTVRLATVPSYDGTSKNVTWGRFFHTSQPLPHPPRLKSRHQADGLVLTTAAVSQSRTSPASKAPFNLTTHTTRGSLNDGRQERSSYGAKLTQQLPRSATQIWGCQFWSYVEDYLHGFTRHLLILWSAAEGTELQLP